MAVAMTSLTRAKNGDWFARKGIPESVRAAYKAAFGVSQEERFRRPASLPMGQAKIELRDWDAEITSRIERLRAQATGGGVSLSFREAHGLAGQWYGWFISRHEEEPGRAGDWDIEHSQWEDARTRFAGAEEAGEESLQDHPNVRRHLRSVLMTVLAGMAEFERDLMLERQRAGIAAAKAKGKYKGRAPTARAKASEVAELWHQGMGATEIASKLGIARASVYRILGVLTGRSAENLDAIQPLRG